MSKSVSPPWLLPYLTKVAETTGGNFISAEPHPQSKKVQIIKFLTLQLPDKDNWIWVVVSDLKHTIPARISKDAMDAYSQHSIFGNKTISSYKTALTQIKHFKPNFARIPRGVGTEGLTQNEHLFLEINEFDLKGSFGDPVWGRPTDVEAVEDMKVWADGIRAGGGGGNVLKLRKEEREQASTSKNAAEDLHSSSQRPRSLRPVTQAQQSINGFVREDEASRKSSRSTSPVHRGKRKSKELTAKERYLRRWRAARRDEQDPTPFLVSTEEGNAKLKGAQRKPLGPRRDDSEDPRVPAAIPEVELPRTPKRRRGALDMSSSPARHSDGIRSPSPILSDDPRPQTPSAWSPSVHGGSQMQHSDVEEDCHMSHEEVAQRYSSPLFNCRPRSNVPSPAELSPEVPIASLEDTHYGQEEVDEGQGAPEHELDELPPSSPPHPTSSFRPPTPAQRPKPKLSSPLLTTPLRSTLQPPGDLSQLPHSTSQAADLTGSLPTPTSSPASPAKRFQRANQRGMTRHQQLSDQGRVLVPNSDTSGTTASQSNPSQPRRTFGLPSSQPQGDGPFLDSLSQLPLDSQVPVESQEDSQARYGQSLSYTTGSQSQGKDASQPVPQGLPQPSPNEDEDAGAAPAAPPDSPKAPLSGEQDLVPAIDAIRTDGDDDDATETESEEDQLMSPVIPMAIDIEALKQEEEEESQEQPQYGHLGEFDTDDERVDDDVRVALGNGTAENILTQAPKPDSNPHPESSPSHTPPMQPSNLLKPPPSERSILQSVTAFASNIFSGRLSGSRSAAVVQKAPPPDVQTNHSEPTANVFHDAEAWKQPAFVRRRAESSRQSSSISDKPAIPTVSNGDTKAAGKRTHSSSSEDNKPSAPRGVKRRRVLRSRSSVNDQRPRKRTRRSSITVIVSSSPEPSPPPSPRIASTPTSDARSKAPSDARGQGNPPIRSRVDDIVKTAGPSTRAASKEVPPPETPRHINLRESLSLSAKGKGKRPMRPSTSFVYEAPAASRNTSKSTPTTTRSLPVPKATKDTAPKRPSPKPKLDGFKLDLSMKPDDLDGMGVTWPQLQEFLLSVGQSRYKAKRRSGG